MLLGRGKNQATFVICNTSGWKEEKKFTALSTVLSLFIKKSPFYHIFTEIIHLFIRFMYFAFLQTEQNGKRM